ncbi:hypothetical protein BsWGS_16807 [Bradybaena similaris]
MAFMYGFIYILTVLIFRTNCQQALVAGSFNPYPGNMLQSMASQVPALSQKATAGSNFPGFPPPQAPLTGSSFPPPQPPQALLNAFKMGLPPGAASGPSSIDKLMGMFRGAGTGNSAAVGHVNKPSLPVTPGTKVMVTKWATQMGYKAYYEAHGCVDPTTTLLGQQARMASIALMMGCNNFMAHEVCDMAQLAHTGGQGTSMRTMMDMMIGKDTKHMLEECLTPSTFMDGIGSMMGSKQQTAPAAAGYAPPPATASQPKKAVNCSSVTQMLMMSAATEGLLNPETLEQIGTMRNRYFKMTCQENLIMGSLPYRLCCPGHVKAPTMQEAMMIRSMGAM